MAVRAKSPASEKSKNAQRGRVVRSKHGYSATKYDASVVGSPKTLRHQFGEKYDAKKVRNTSSKRAPGCNVFGVLDAPMATLQTPRFLWLPNSRDQIRILALLRN
jgi:hypothetical protein